MEEMSYVIGIKLFHDWSQELIELSHKAYINKFLKRLEYKYMESAPYMHVLLWS